MEVVVQLAVGNNCKLEWSWKEVETKLEVQTKLVVGTNLEVETKLEVGIELEVRTKLEVLKTNTQSVYTICL